MTSAQIAEQLYISRATTNQHLSRIAAKLGLRRVSQTPLTTQPAEPE
jgi:DNA-binding CsgD family transcriptional regulator